MILQRHVPQPTTDYRELFRMAGEAGSFDEVAGAFAYGTRAGACLIRETLMQAIPSFDTTGVTKRWLLGIDWCRTDPDTFPLLAKPPGSTVRVHDGAFLVQQKGCTPRLPWHPKVLLLRGPDSVAVIAGSGNMSRNGLSRGHEVGSVTVVSNPTSARERAARDSCLEMINWFDRMWKQASNVKSIERLYGMRFKELVKGVPPTTDEDTLPATLVRGWTADRLRQLRTSRHLWIDAGNLHENRGIGKPGNQLMMTRMTRVFFGFAAEDLPTDSTLGNVAIRFASHLRRDCSLRYSNNSMDVLTLPVPGVGGPAAYDQESLRFTRKVEKGQVIYELALGSKADRRAWVKASRAAGGEFTMHGSGRAWGVIP